MEGSEGCYPGQAGVRKSGTGPRKSPGFAPQLLKEQEAGGAGMGSGVRQNAPDGAGSACTIGGEGPPVPLPERLG